MSGILGFITALPSLINLLKDIFEFIKKMVGEDPAQFVKDSSAVFTQLKQAKSVEERSNAAASIQALIRRL